MKTKKLLTWVAASTMLVGLAACNNNTPEPQPEPPEVTLEKIECTSLPGQLVYFVGEEFDTEGLEVTATYSDASTKKVSDYTLSLADGYEFTEEDFGNKQVKVTYQEKTADFTVKVLKVRLTGIQLDTNAVKAVYRLGEEFDPTGLIVYGLYNNDDKARVSGYTISQPDLSTYGEHEVYVDYEGYRASFTVEVREDEWYEVIDTFLDAYGVEIDLPYDVLLSTELEEAVISVGEDDNGDEYIGLQFLDLNPAMHSYLVRYLLVYYGIEPTNFALIGYDLDYYNYGYAQFNVMSGIIEDGSYIEVNFVGCDEGSVYESYFDEEAKFEMQIFFRKADLAADVAEEFKAALYGVDSVTKLEDEAEFIEDFTAVSEFVAVKRTMTANAQALEETKEFLEIMESYAKDAASFSDGYYGSGEDYIYFDFSPAQHSVQDMMEVMFTVLRYDFGFIPYMNPTNLGEEEDPIYFSLMLSPDGMFGLQLSSLDYYGDGTLYFEIQVLFLESALTGYESYEVYLPLAGDEIAKELLAKVNEGAYTVYDQWTEAYGYFVISDELNEESAAAWIQVSASELRNAVAFNVFANSPLWNTSEDIIPLTNDVLATYFGFETQLPDFGSAIPFTLFGLSEDYKQMQFQIFDNDDPGSEEYSGHAVEDDILAILVEDGNWEIDDSSYETSGYFAYSKERKALLPGDLESYIVIQFYSWDYFFYMNVTIEYAKEAFPAEQMMSVIEEKYGEAVGNFGLEEFAAALGDEKFIVSEGTLSSGEDYILAQTDSMSDESYDLFHSYASALYELEGWTAVDGEPGSYGTYDFVNDETGLTVEIYYDYDFDLSTFSYINYGYVAVIFPVEGAPVYETFTEAIEGFAEIGGAVLFESDAVTALNALAGNGLEFSYGLYDKDEALVTLQPTADMTPDQMDALYQAQTNLYNAIKADAEANPDNWLFYYEDVGADACPEGYESLYIIAYYFHDGGKDSGEDPDASYGIYFTTNYGMGIQIDVIGDYGSSEGGEVIPEGFYELGSIVKGQLYNAAYYNWCELDFNTDGEFECSWYWQVIKATSKQVVIQTSVETYYQLDVLLGQLETALEEMGLEYYGSDGTYFYFKMDCPGWVEEGYSYVGHVLVGITYSVNQETGMIDVRVIFQFSYTYGA